MDKLREVTREIVNIANDGTNDYDIFDDVLKVLKKEFIELVEEEVKGE